MRWVRALVVLVALVVAAGAVVWVAAFGFRDHKSGVDCGVPLVAMWHGHKVPRFESSELTITHACAPAARARVAIAVVIVLASTATAMVVVRAGRPTPARPG